MFTHLLSKFWTPASTPPPVDAHVIACTGLDTGGMDIIVTTGLIVDGQLDPVKLEATLSLLVKEKFPRAGARLARANGRYEYHIPHTFDATRPAIAFSSQHHAESYASPSRPPIPSNRHASATTPVIQGDIERLDAFFRSPSTPPSVAAFLKPNVPLLHVHVVTFHDTTFIGLTSSHVLLDAMGTKILIRAWTRLLAGEPLADIEGMPWDFEAFAGFTQPTPGWHQQGWFRLGLLSIATWIVQRVLLPRLRDPKEVGMHVRVPKAFLEAEKRRVMEELKAAGSEDWVGSSDVLLAWWLKTAYQHRSDNTQLYVQIPANIRDHHVFPTESKTIEAPFVNNAILAVPVPPFTLKHIRSMTLQEIALQIRRAILAYGADIETLQKDLHWRCPNPAPLLFPCPPGAEFSMQTNWRDAKFGAMDFSGALVDGKGSGGVVGVSMITTGTSVPLRNNGVILFEDDECVWMGQVKGAKDWEAIKKGGGVEFF
ncbi:hypothetical protein MKEN_00415200 [Mycena kentingensis (nom. inval.)]|nr:hypothetical protein MKEN_00415200 [Mycena kentingensis (nom. inval.)]